MNQPNSGHVIKPRGQDLRVGLDESDRQHRAHAA
jgi:hypothetical protein